MQDNTRDRSKEGVINKVPTFEKRGGEFSPKGVRVYQSHSVHTMRMMLKLCTAARRSQCSHEQRVCREGWKETIAEAGRETEAVARH